MKFALAPRTQLAASLVFAAIGLWLFFRDGIEVGGVSLAFVGAWCLVAATWFFVDAIQRVPRSEPELAIAPGEWQAWVGTVFLTAVLVAMVLARDAFAAHVPILENPAAAEAGRSIATLFVAWVVLAWVLRQRWNGAVVADERDERIGQLAGQWGRVGTIVLVVGVALMLGFSPTDRLEAYSYPALAHMLAIALVFGAWLEGAAAALMYLRDRRATAA